MLPTETVVPVKATRAPAITFDRKSCSVNIPAVQLGQCSYADLTATKKFVITLVCSGNSGLTPADIMDVIIRSWFGQARSRRDGEQEELGIVAAVVFKTATPSALINDAVELLNEQVEAGSLSVDVSIGGKISSRTVNELLLASEIVSADDSQAAEEDEDYLDLDMLQEVLHESTPSNSSSASGEESREDPLGLIPLLLEMQVEVVKQMKKDFRFVVDLMDSLRNNPNFKPLFQALQRMGLTVSDMLWRYLPS